MSLKKLQLEIQKSDKDEPYPKQTSIEYDPLDDEDNKEIELCVIKVTKDAEETLIVGEEVSQG